MTTAPEPRVPADHARAAALRKAAAERLIASEGETFERRSLADVLNSPYVAGPILMVGGHVASQALGRITGKDDQPPKHAKPKD